jgi:nucleotide-binding universal stress UspA family protein
MRRKLLHVYRNTALGRETLLQSAWFCRQTGCRLEVYVPRHPQLLLYLERAVATVTLDSSYLRDPDSAEQRARSIASELRIAMELVEPSGFTTETLPNLKGEYAFMACPRSMSERSSRIRFGHLGPRVRAIIKAASFPVLLPTPVYKPWSSIVVCYGGSENAIRALRCARRLSKDAGVPLSIFTWAEGKARAEYEDPLGQAGLLDTLESESIAWHFAAGDSLEECLFDISREALIVCGAYGHGAVREALFGSKPETIQTELPNNLLILGPNVPGGLG